MGARTATASGFVRLSPATLEAIRTQQTPKGNALEVARIAGILAAKRTAELIPLCHPLPLSFVGVDLKLADDPPSVEIEATVRTSYKTGAEMEALTAVSVAALTIYDMGKSVDKGMTIEKIELLEKSGGKSGKWRKIKK